MVLLSALAGAACHTAPTPKDSGASKDPDSAAVDTLLAQSGIQLSDLPIGHPMPGDVMPPDDGLLPASLPEFIPGLDDAMPDWDVTPTGGENLASPGGWMRSGADAIRLARQKELPIVLWLANTQVGPLDTTLGAKVLFTPALAETLGKNAVALRIDYGNDTARKSTYYNAFRQRYHVKGYPCVLVLMPDGTEVSRQNGYVAGTDEARIQNLKSDITKAAAAWKTRRNDLQKAGFRHWTDRSGADFFAKALRRDDQQAILIDPFRRVFRIPLTRFSHESLVDLLDGLKPATENSE